MRLISAIRAISAMRLINASLIQLVMARLVYTGPCLVPDWCILGHAVYEAVLHCWATGTGHEP